MDISEYNRRMNAILTAMDVRELRQLAVESDVPVSSSDGVLEVSMHKTRVERSGIDPQLRLESIEWLKSRGYSRWRGLPWPPEGQLPE